MPDPEAALSFALIAVGSGVGAFTWLLAATVARDLWRDIQARRRRP